MIGVTKLLQNGPQEGQCNYFVMRKKRFCRMTVRPGRQYCGEHEPKPKTDDGQDDTRIPCPLDPKHTCYASKLEKHLSICNAKKTDVPAYIINNINGPTYIDSAPKTPLNEVPTDFLEKVVEKINSLFSEHISQQLTTFAPPPIHSSVLAEFSEPHRGEKSLKHLRQVSSLLHIAETEGLVRERTCYVELGAGKGQLSYYLGVSWCRDTQSRVLSIDRAALRHKRDNLLRTEWLKNAKTAKLANQSQKTNEDLDGNARSEKKTNEDLDANARKTNEDLDGNAQSAKKTNAEFKNGNTESVLKDAVYANMEPVAVRLRADLAHLSLEKVPVVRECDRIVGFAKHLCGVAMDYALRCLATARAHCAGAALATCCHHRCLPSAYVASEALQNLGITSEDFKVILSIVSWATCGDGRSRDLRKIMQQDKEKNTTNQVDTLDNKDSTSQVEPNEESSEKRQKISVENSVHHAVENQVQANFLDLKDHTVRAEIGRKAKLLLDWGRVLYLREQGFDARLCYYVPTTVSLENICIVVKKTM